MRYKISPSILSANFGKLNLEVRSIERFADSLHLDVMDGHFVRNISYGVPVIKDISTKLPMDCHLMIADPVKYAHEFAPYVDRIFFHSEIFEKDTDKIKEALDSIKRLKVKVGLTINPDKSADLIIPYLKLIDAVLIMSVYAGFGGQKFIPDVLVKVKEIRRKGFKKDIIIDGGIDKFTIKLAKQAGANVFVSGNAIFGKKDRKKAIRELRDSLYEST